MGGVMGYLKLGAAVVLASTFAFLGVGVVVLRILRHTGDSADKAVETGAICGIVAAVVTACVVVLCWPGEG